MKQPDAVLTIDSPAVREFVACTAGNEIAAVAGIVESNGGDKPYITQIVARGGELIGYYRKRHVVDDELDWFTPGPATAPVWDHAGVRFGLAVCADIDAPWVYQDVAQAGAQLVLECAAPGLYGEQATRNWETSYAWWRGECHTKLAGYARSFGVFVGAATQAGRTVDEDFPGGGYLFGPDGECIAETPDWREGVLCVDVPLSPDDRR
jgi:predicted amidohydrolase